MLSKTSLSHRCWVIFPMEYLWLYIEMKTKLCSGQNEIFPYLIISLHLNFFEQNVMKFWFHMWKYQNMHSGQILYMILEKSSIAFSTQYGIYQAENASERKIGKIEWWKREYHSGREKLLSCKNSDIDGEIGICMSL